MFERILLTHDGSLKTEGLVPVLRSLTAAEGARLELLHVLTDASVEANDGDADWLEKDVRGRLEALATEITGEGEPAEVLVARGDPAKEILRVAEERDVSLLAMATRGRSGAERWLMGSVAEEVLRECERPVLVRNRPETGTVTEGGEAALRTIALPLDGSEESAKAVAPAMELARRFDAGIVVLHVTPPAPSHAVPPEPTPPPEDPLVGPQVERIRGSGIEVRLEKGGGDPAHGVHDLLENVEPDLVVMRTKRRSGLPRILLGSVAEHSIRHTNYPFLLVGD